MRLPLFAVVLGLLLISACGGRGDAAAPTQETRTIYHSPVPPERNTGAQLFPVKKGEWIPSEDLIAGMARLDEQPDGGSYLNVHVDREDKNNDAVHLHTGSCDDRSSSPDDTVVIGKLFLGQLQAEMDLTFDEVTSRYVDVHHGRDGAVYFCGEFFEFR